MNLRLIRYLFIIIVFSGCGRNSSREFLPSLPCVGDKVYYEITWRGMKGEDLHAHVMLKCASIHLSNAKFNVCYLSDLQYGKAQYTVIVDYNNSQNIGENIIRLPGDKLNVLSTTVNGVPVPFRFWIAGGVRHIPTDEFDFKNNRVFLQRTIVSDGKDKSGWYVEILTKKQSLLRQYWLEDNWIWSRQIDWMDYKTPFLTQREASRISK